MGDSQIVTVDTITDDQIRELRNIFTRDSSPWHDANDALLPPTDLRWGARERCTVNFNMRYRELLP